MWFSVSIFTKSRNPLFFLIFDGNSIFVSGFPLPTSSVNESIWRFLKGQVVANATVAIKDGYQLLYSNPTLPGMSGGSVLDSQGNLVGIHW